MELKNFKKCFRSSIVQNVQHLISAPSDTGNLVKSNISDLPEKTKNIKSEKYFLSQKHKPKRGNTDNVPHP